MLTADGPKMLEYNVRFGDPECQVVIPRLRTDLGELCRAAAAGEDLPDVDFATDACVTVVLASENYPASPRTGDVIEGLEDAAQVDGAIVFHAGTSRDGEDLVTAGGRVFSVSALDETVGAARARAYEAADRIRWPGRQRRGDIAAGV
jgi:phosphoribosylamine---glycine ligase